MRVLPRLHRLLDLFYPPLCLHCGGLVQARRDEGAPHCLCAACLTDCVPVEFVRCARCGAPAVSGREAGAGPCSACSAAPPPFVAARSAFLYRESGAVRSVLYRIKHQADSRMMQEIAEWMLPAAREVCQSLERPVLCPIPLHWSRQWRRGYNQAEWIALELGKRLRLPMASLLRRSWASRKQKGGRLERFERLRGIFRVDAPELTRGRDVLLVDDVLTTGSTTTHASLALRQAGARSVGVVTLARVHHREA